MPAVEDAQRFIELIRKSKLIPEARFTTALEELRSQHGGEYPADVDVMQQFLIEKGFLTDWHCTKLRVGKYKGFFLSKYRLLKHLGTGGMSSVYLAEHILMNRKVAIKVLPRRRVNDSSYLARFHLEAQAAAHLDHPNIVRAFDVDNEDDTHYIVMEYVPGCDLHQYVKGHGPVGFEAAADYIAQAADGLQHAHDKGVVHRDIKPANLLLDDNGMVKILDMGLARLKQDENASLTIAHSENVLGTADYLAPEQAVNSHRVDHRVDIYSLGCSLYFLLTGHPPFPEGSLAQRIAKHQSVMPDKIKKSRPNCPPSLARICERMIAKQPDDRFSSAADVASELRGWVESRGKVLSSNEGTGNLSVRERGPGQSHVSGAPGKPAEPHPPVPAPSQSNTTGVDDLLPPDMRESPSSSHFDPAIQDTVASVDDTTPKPTQPGETALPRATMLPVAQALDADFSDQSPPSSGSSQAGQSPFNSSALDDDPFDIPAESNPGGSVLVSSAALKQQMQERQQTEQRRKSKVSGNSSEAGLNISVEGIPAIIWVVVAVLFMLIGILIAISYQKTEDDSQPKEIKSKSLEGVSLMDSIGIPQATKSGGTT